MNDNYYAPNSPTTTPTSDVATLDSSGLVNNTNNVLSLDQIAPGQPLNIPSTVPAGSPVAANPDAAVAAGKTYEDYFKETSAPNTTTQDKAQTITDETEALLPKLAGKTQALADKEDELGVTNFKMQLADLNATILSRSAEYDKMVTDLEANAGRMGETTSTLFGQQGAVLRQKASDIGLLQARALGLQGKVQAATDAAARAIDLKYASIEDSINIKMKQLALLGPQLSKDEAKQATALQRQYEDQKQKITEMKAAQKENMTLAFQLSVKTPFVNKGGEWFRVADGKPYKNPIDFFKDSGVKSFAEAYAKGMVTDASQQSIDERAIVTNMSNKYIDAGIKPSDSLETATAKAKKSRIFAKETHIAPGSGGDVSPADIKAAQNDAYSQVVGAWKNNGYFQGNGKIASSDYQNAKNEWVRSFTGYTANPASEFDNLFSIYADKSSEDWETDYGIGKK